MLSPLVYLGRTGLISLPILDPRQVFVSAATGLWDSTPLAQIFSRAAVVLPV